MLIYAFIASALFYAVIVRLSAILNLNIIFSGVAAAVGYFAFHLLFTLPLRIGSGVPLLQTIEMSEVVIFLLQAAVGIWVFYKLRKNEDSLESWLLWVIIGFVMLFVAIPFAISKVL